MVNCCIKHVRVGRSGTAAHGHNLADFNWDALDHPNPSSAVFVEEYPNNPEIEPDVHSVVYDYCFADVARNNAVDIDDLLAVIGAWGDCPAAPSGVTGPPPPCAGDIEPPICGDNVVDIDDLLMEISEWGPCHHPECGSNDPVDGGEQEAPPQTDADCWDKCWEAHPNGGPIWVDCYNACVQALDEIASSGGGP